VTTPSWVHPQETKPAPPPLLLVQSFVNTWEAETATDLLAGPDTAAHWLRVAGLIGGDAAVRPAELRRAREVRESLRALLAHNAGGPRPTAEDLAPLHALARRGRPRLSVDPGGRMLLGPQPRDSLSAGLLGLLLVVRDAQQQGSWPRLKACRNPDCRWAFFDRSHARRGAWCDMATCGNMIKNRNLRARHR
jgi:predicted RNA-binding Zn ribbon-like protein